MDEHNGDSGDRPDPLPPVEWVDIGGRRRDRGERDLRTAGGFDTAADHARDLAGALARGEYLGGTVGDALRDAGLAARRLAESLDGLADIARERFETDRRSRVRAIADEYVDELLAVTPTGGRVSDHNPRAFGRQLSIADELDDVGPDHADARPEQHASDCAALAGFDCDHGCPDGRRWNAERARRVAARAAADRGPARRR